MSRLVGHIDRLSPGGKLAGWLVDQDTPEAPATATLLLDDAPVAALMARLPRPDVLAAGHRPLLSGFEIAIPARYLDGRSRRISVRAGDGSVVRLPGVEAVLVERRAEGVASITTDGERVEGWAIDPSQPTRQLFVDVAVDGRHVATAACVKDPANKQSTSSGLLPVATFSAPLTAFRGAGMGFHEVSVSVSGYAGTLHRTPLRLPRAGMLEAGVEGFVAGRLNGWSFDPENRRPLPIKVFCDGELVGEVTPEGHRTDLAQRYGVTEGGFSFELPRRVYDGVPHRITATGHLDMPLPGAPMTLGFEEQLLHRLIGALRVNNATGDGGDYGFVARDLHALVAGPAAQALSETSRELGATLTADLTHHATFTLSPQQSYALLRDALDANALNYDDPTVALALAQAMRELDVERRAEVSKILAKPEHRSRPYRAALVAALQFAVGDTSSAVSILFNICSRPRVSDAMVRFCAEMLVQEGLSEEAKDLVFFSVVAKSTQAA